MRRERMMEEEVRSGRVRPCGAVRVRKQEKKRGCRRAATKVGRMPVRDAMERGPLQLLSLVAVGQAIVRIVKALTIRDDDADAQAGAAAGCWLAAGLLLLVLVFRRRNTHSPARPASACAGRLQPTRPGGGPSLANQTPVSPNPLLARPRLHTPFHAAALEAAVRQRGPTEA